MPARTSSGQRRKVAALLGLALAVSACGTGGSSNEGQAADPDASVKPGCEAYADYQGSSGTTVSVYTSIRDAEADAYVETFKEFEDCTGITIAYEGSGEFEAQLNVKVQGNNAPDIAFIPQPGLLERFAKAGKLVEPSEATVKNAEEYYSEAWRSYATVDGKFYGAPNSGNVKSFVWYSPKAFTAAGYEVPKTFDELIELSDTIAATGKKPWCAGIESGDATGWTTTDWTEDLMLRDAGVDTYDKWVAHEIPFNDPAVVSAVDKVGSILKNEKYVNGGYGDVRSIATVPFGDGGLPITKGECSLHRQASFYSSFWPAGTKIAEDGDVYAFYFPAIDASKGKPVLGGGEFVVAFADRPEVQHVQTYLASPEFVNARVKAGPFTSAHTGLDASGITDPIGRLSVEILQDEESEFRFDGSDLMPAAVGSGSFWKGMTEWINGKSTTEILGNIEASYPKS
ncbi:MAG: family 1 extracellular solute-binding protein [Frankiales bacterium]|nr:family 1 extracellular solute-binding protein [Frankiales bacterium]